MNAEVVVVDLGLGNLGSVLQAIARAGGAARLSAERRAIEEAPRVLLPGVAAFGLGMERATKLHLKAALSAVIARKAPLLGICLGMQLLFEEGDEDGSRKGLGLLPGRVTRLPLDVPQPHIGWQRLSVLRPGALLGEGAPWSYFAHSYRCEAPAELICATVEHAAPGREPARIAAVVERGSVYGVQFHPEKSSHDGKALLQRFLSLPAGEA